MKAVLMAAGLGTRLFPLTMHTPKCMVPIRGVPLLGWWLKKLARAEVKEVIINLHHLPDQVISFVQSQDWGLTVHFVYEEVLLGSLGTLKANRSLLDSEPSFLVVYADNLTDLELGPLLNYHRSHNEVATMALFKSEHPERCGVAQLDSNSVVVEFEEKPAAPRTNLANAGIYVFNESIWEYTAITRLPSDIGYDLLPRLVGRMAGYPIEGFFIDIGTSESLDKGSESWNYDYQ